MNCAHGAGPRAHAKPALQPPELSDCLRDIPQQLHAEGVERGVIVQLRWLPGPHVMRVARSHLLQDALSLLKAPCRFGSGADDCGLQLGVAALGVGMRVVQLVKDWLEARCDARALVLG